MLGTDRMVGAVQGVLDVAQGGVTQFKRVSSGAGGPLPVTSPEWVQLACVMARKQNRPSDTTWLPGAR